MILATIADLAEADEGELPAALTLLQRQIKSGLPSLAALGFFEAGFADRIVAQALAARFPDVSDRQGISIGAIIAGNAPGNRVKRLRSFWQGGHRPRQPVALCAPWGTRRLATKG
jgi:hypothetical protein